MRARAEKAEQERDEALAGLRERDHNDNGLFMKAWKDHTRALSAEAARDAAREALRKLIDATESLGRQAMNGAAMDLCAEARAALAEPQSITQPNDDLTPCNPCGGLRGTHQHWCDKYATAKNNPAEPQPQPSPAHCDAPIPEMDNRWRARNECGNPLPCATHPVAVETEDKAWERMGLCPVVLPSKLGICAQRLPCPTHPALSPVIKEK